LKVTQQRLAVIEEGIRAAGSEAYLQIGENFMLLGGQKLAQTLEEMKFDEQQDEQRLLQCAGLK